MECIICQDKGSEPLQENTFCTCKYKTHNSCWIDYVHSKDKVTCLLCRKDITFKPATIHTPFIEPTVPQISPISIPHIEVTPYIPSGGQQITYQEFVEIIRQHNQPQHTVITIPTAVPQPNSKKMMKVLIGLFLVFVILIFFILILKGF